MCNSSNCQSSIVKVEVVINFTKNNSFYTGSPIEFDKFALSMAKKGMPISLGLNKENIVEGEITKICLRDASFNYGLLIFIVVDGPSYYIMPAYKWTKIPAVKMD